MDAVFTPTNAATERVLQAAGVDVIVSNAGGCGAALKEYHHWLRDDPEWGPRVRAFVARMKDVSELVATLDLPPLR